MREKEVIRRCGVTNEENEGLSRLKISASLGAVFLGGIPLPTALFFFEGKWSQSHFIKSIHETKLPVHTLTYNGILFNHKKKENSDMLLQHRYILRHRVKLANHKRHFLRY